MPILNDLPPSPGDWIDPDLAPRPVVTFGIEMETPGGLELQPHRHAKGQIQMALRGLLSCEVEGGLWIVPPQSAIWIPGGELHAVKAAGKVRGYSAFIDAANASRLPARCCTISVTPLLRELLIRSANLPMLYPEVGPEAHLAALLIDEMAAAPIGDLHLPMPADGRLREMARIMMANPGAGGTKAAWAARAGFSERTFARRLARETGMSFGRWRQQLNVMLALRWLAEGRSIQQIAADLGYESASSFVTRFRKVLGAPPGRYMTQRHGRLGLEPQTISKPG